MKISGCNKDEALKKWNTPLKSDGIDFKIEPPYPHKIIEYKKEWTEEDIRMLMEANPGLQVTAEERNAL